MKIQKHNKVEYNQIEISPLYYLGRACWTALRTFFLICISFIILYPLVYMLSMSIRSYLDFYDVTVIWIPRTFTMENFSFLINKMNLTSSIMNTLLITVTCTVAQMFVTSFTAYGFARFKFRGNGLLFGVVLFTIMVPPQMLNIPNYLLMKNFDIFRLISTITGSMSPIKLLDSVWCFLLPAVLGQGLRAGLFILIFRQFYTGLSAELEEAAMIDGCGYLKTYFRIMMPNAKNVFVICGLFSLVWYWSDYYTAASFLSSMKTMAIELSSFRVTLEEFLPIAERTAYRIVPLEQAACLLFILPLIILFVVFQRFFTQGIDKTGIVG